MQNYFSSYFKIEGIRTWKILENSEKPIVLVLVFETFSIIFLYENLKEVSFTKTIKITRNL